MTHIDLSAVPSKVLQAELARRELASPKAESLKRQKWICKCGNSVVGGGDFSTAFVMAGQVWCRICCPGMRPNFYGNNGAEASVPMLTTATSIG